MKKRDESLSLEEQVERIRKKRAKGGNNKKTRDALNSIFLLFAVIGLVWYFTTEENKLWALGVIAFGMLFKVIELFIRFVF